MSRDDMIHAAWAMERFGGGFAQALAKLIYHADKSNMTKIAEAWPDELKAYLAVYNEYRKHDDE